MKFNPFAENKIPSVSMFSKEPKKQIQATTEAAEDLEERFGTKEYLGVKMNNETLTFFKALVSQIGEEGATEITKRDGTQIDGTGKVIRLDCDYNNQITTLPELPAGLTELYCCYTTINALPALPAGLKKLNCGHTLITSLPELPSGLEVLDCNDTYITSLPALPAGLVVFDCEMTNITLLPELPTSLLLLNCNKTLITWLPELPAGLTELRLFDTPLAKDDEDENFEYITELRKKHPGLDVIV